MTHYDVIVLGGGTMGIAAAWELAKRGKRALVLEQFALVHDRGAHSGQTRIFRHAYAEGPEYIPLVMRADALWMALEAETKTTVLHRVGGLEMAAPGYLHARRARDSAAHYGIDFQWLTPAEVRHTWPMIAIPDDWEAGFGAGAGFLDVEPALYAMLALARRGGVTLHANAPVCDWGASAQGVWVQTANERYDAEALIVTAGAWTGRLLAQLGLPLTIQRKVLWWLAVEDPAVYAPARFPVFITDSVHGEVYGFPVHGQPGFKIANHAGGEPTDPDNVERTVRDEEKHDVVGLASWFFTGVTSHVLRSTVCLYARTPDTHFILDRHPVWPQVVIGAGFSGHGFKFTPAIGEHLVSLALERDLAPHALFRIARFAR
ncbi:MAG: N-methyl-L-tryptophan oxidase [Candidatus Tectomicrobia bacterium]|uniref:N-methyl-L-tryptophan oxidase n=1 Tax=Tectimicrobiota bacterium TaxID=2528274 RepID=A0A937W7K4_UNCTE|nr:N-methyl-L-tryptophan oxidase [Candidatus Tectomicrobia bacterium]